jgi:hypothetical protein
MPTYVANGLSSDQRTEGTWVHTGRLIISVRLDNGTVLKFTLPDDLVKLGAVNSIEDLTYGG